MSLNQSYAIDKKNAARKGKIFGSIDFEVRENINKSAFTTHRGKTVVGTLFIDGRSFDVTLAEIQRITETCRNAEGVVSKKYKMFR